jgi:hypothetical protein
LDRSVFVDEMVDYGGTLKGWLNSVGRFHLGIEAIIVVLMLWSLAITATL